YPNARVETRPAHNRLDRLGLPRSHFKYYFTVAHEPSRTTASDPAIESHPIAPARQGDPRLEVTDFGRESGKLGFDYVWRVGNNEIEGRPLVVQHLEAITLKKSDPLGASMSPRVAGSN